jgi:hypothetical protein
MKMITAISIPKWTVKTEEKFVVYHIDVTAGEKFGLQKFSEPFPEPN